MTNAIHTHEHAELALYMLALQSQQRRQSDASRERELIAADQLRATMKEECRTHLGRMFGR